MAKANKKFSGLIAFISRIPSVDGAPSSGKFDDDKWWIKFRLDIKHPAAWSVVQELATVLNYLSVSERLPTVFKPVSPPSYLNGGPEQFLSWVIESTESSFSPDDAREWLEGRLPTPVDDLAQWKLG